MSRSNPGARSETRLSGFSLALLFISNCGGHAQHTAPPGAASANANAGSSAAGVGGQPSAGTAGEPHPAGADSASTGQGGTGSESNGDCAPGRAPLRRLTNREYVNSLLQLLPDAEIDLNALPAEIPNLPFDNEAERQTVSSERAAAYLAIAKQVAERTTQDPVQFAKLSPCAASISAATVEGCARSTIEPLASAAFRRPATPQELDELVALHDAVRSAGGDFVRATAAVLAAILQAPDFLYRIEWGTSTGERADGVRPTGDEMATRLSYLFWGAPPDAELRAAAKSGTLLTGTGVKAQAARLLADARSQTTVSAFFDALLGLGSLTALTRADRAYTPAIGAQLRESTQRFLSHEIFEANGSWPSVLTAPYAFVNGAVSSFYGSGGVSGDAFVQTPQNAAERLGLLTQPSLMAVSSPTDSTNPSQRGAFVLQNFLCRAVPPGHTDTSTLPVPTGATARERWAQLISEPTCMGCHQDMDQLGFALENYDALGRYRDRENGTAIETSAEVSGLGKIAGPIALSRRLSELPETQACFAERWAEFGYGKSLGDDPADQCLMQDLTRAFQSANYNVRDLLLNLTQTDAFLYLPKDR